MKNRYMGFVQCASWLLIVGLSAAQARADQLAGIVKSVNADAKKMVVVESGTDKSVDIAVDDQTRLLTNNGVSLGLKYLKKGDGVGIAYANGLASTIIVNQAILRGVVDTVDIDGKKIVVSEADTDRDVDVPVAADTAVELSSGKVLALKDVKTGDGVGIAYAGPVATKIVVNPKPPEVRGHVESVGADLKSMVIKELGTKANISVSINSKTTLVTTTGKSIEVKELKKGDGVAVAHDASVASKIVVDVAEAR